MLNEAVKDVAGFREESRKEWLGWLRHENNMLEESLTRLICKSRI